VVSDLHLSSYRLDFAPTDNPDSTAAWEQIFVQSNLYQQEKDKQLKQPQAAKFENLAASNGDRYNWQQRQPNDPGRDPNCSTNLRVGQCHTRRSTGRTLLFT